MAPLELRVELAKRLTVIDIEGKINTAECKVLEADAAAFYAAELKYMPDILTAKLSVPLATLRGLKVGKPKSFDVNHTDNGIATPPSDCSVGDAECTQQLGWTGSIEVTRMG